MIHQKHSHPELSVGTINCKETGCSHNFLRVKNLAAHLQTIHGYQIEKQSLVFPNIYGK